MQASGNTVCVCLETVSVRDIFCTERILRQKSRTLTVLNNAICVCIFRADNRSRRLDFYFQLQRLTSVTDTSLNISIILYRAIGLTATSGSSGGGEAVDSRPDSDPASSASSPAEPIYEQRSVDAGYMRYILSQLGGISQRRATLCWSTVDRVLCGRLTRDGRVRDIKIAVHSRQAVAVCSGSLTY